MIRFLDRKDLKELVKQSSDFNKRRYGSLMKWISYGIIIVAFAIALRVNNVLYGIYTGVDMVLASDVLLTIIFMGTVGLVVTAYLIAVIYKLRHILTAVEFQATMFSGALRANIKFVIIANPKNTIVYADKEAYAIFSKDHMDTIDNFIGSNIPNTKDRDKIISAIKAGVVKELNIIYKTSEGKEQPCQISILPIDKPKGYFVLKGIHAKGKDQA